MRLPVSDQWQPRPYLAPFSHNTSVTDRRQLMPIARPLLKYGRLKTQFAYFVRTEMLAAAGLRPSVTNETDERYANEFNEAV